LVEKRAILNSTLVDGIQGLPDLLISGQKEPYLMKVLERSQSLGKVQARLAVVNAFQTSAGRLVADFGLLGVLWLGSRQVSLGSLDGLALGALALLAFSCFEAFLPLSIAAQHLSSSLAASGRLFEIADSRPEVIEPSEPLPIPTDFNIRVSNLSFNYPGSSHKAGTETLTHLTFSLAPARKVALVGTSGAGKSTLLNLLLRFWECREGEILLNGVALNRYSGDALRKQMAVLPQNSSLFSATIWDNLRLARPQASQSEIELAARRACLHDWVLNLPDGYQTWVGEGGVKLSGGQRQRLALARTLLRRSPLLILDEPTSHLDPVTEQNVIRGILDTVQENRSSILLVTHRLVGMQPMDEVLVMQNGRIVERGTHLELISSNGLYHKMWDLHA
jgi:ATP-binding cassette subfamily C protein CydC